MTALNPLQCIHTVPLLGIQCSGPAGHDGEHYGPNIMQPQGFVNMVPTLDPQEGDWVLLYGQVLKQERVHPEDLVVRLRSHGQDFECAVVRKHVHTIITAPPGWPRCTHLGEIGHGTRAAYVRCQQPSGHSGDHTSSHGDANYSWGPEESEGYFEEA